MTKLRTYAIIAVFTLVVTTACTPATSQNTAPSESISTTESTTPTEPTTSQTAPREAVNTTDLPLTLPNGFSIEKYASNLNNPRVMAQSPSGDLIVSIPGQNKVVRVSAEGTQKDLLTNLKRPHGVALSGCTKECTLVVGAEDGIYTYTFDFKGTKEATNPKKIIDLPTGGNHWTKSVYIKETQDGAKKLYTALGSTCNVCNETDQRRSKILQSNLDGSELKVFSSGLRNTVFMTEHPLTHDLWGTEMGRDNLGDDLPPDEINILKDGNNYGWPLCYGQNIHDTDFDKKLEVTNPCRPPSYAPAHIALPAHSAPLGIAFVTSDKWPQEYKNNVLVAYHGSWNRTKPTGYKIARFKLDEQGNFIGKEDFITGWLTDKNAVIGRPVDLKFDQEGNLFITDDKLGVIYKVKPV